MGIPLRVLIVEDSEDDTLLLVRELRRGGYHPTWERVDTAEAMQATLVRQDWDVVISDYSMPRFSGTVALELLQQSGRDVPFIFVSGTIGEDTAVAAMRAGASDYLAKGNLKRLVPAIEREVREAAGRRERKRAEERLRQTEKLATMGELLAGVAHELNNPLTVILGQAFFLSEEAAGELLADRAQKISQAAERCARIVKNFLALARQHPPERSKVRLNQVVQEAVQLLAYPLRTDSVEVTLDLAPELPILWADPHQLQQVVVNLVSNAQAVMRETDPPRRLILATRFDSAQEHISLTVTDTGPGIPPEIQQRIFEPFFTTKPPGEGTGLGLSLCQGMVESHGGTISVESRPGHGASFQIELPTQAMAEVGPEGQTAELLPPIRGKTMLVVDDEPEVGEVLAEMLRIDGHQVDIVTNGALALEKLQAREYDLILSDLRMPELDGPGLYRELERRNPWFCRRFIFLTGDTLSAEVRVFLEQTKVPSLTKPFTPDEVRRVVQRALRAF